MNTKRQLIKRLHSGVEIFQNVPSENPDTLPKPAKHLKEVKQASKPAKPRPSPEE